MAGPTIAEAVAAYLDGAELARSSRRTYGVSLRRMARELGPARPLGEVSDAEAVAWCQTAHGASMPASWNRERLTVRSAARWWREQGWRAPSFEALRRRVKQDRTRALPRNEIECVLALDAPLREKTLWRLLYESAARAEEVLALDVEDLDLANRRARAVSKGGDVEWIMLQTGTARLLPEEFGEFLAACRPFYRDHFLTQAGTGLRPGELLGLRRRRVHPERRRIEVLEVRYEAGKFGRGFKDRPKSPASIRVVPMAEAVRGAIVRQLLPGSDPEDLVFTGPSGNRWARRGARPPLSTHNYRRVYKAAIVSKVKAPDGTVIGRPRFPYLDLHGPHDLRHTFATWLEDAGIPSQVIDELMGYVGGRMERGVSPMGALYRETTREMLARATAAIDDRLAVALKVAARLLPEVEERRRSRRARKDV